MKPKFSMMNAHLDPQVMRLFQSKPLTVSSTTIIALQKSGEILLSALFMDFSRKNSREGRAFLGEMKNH